MHNAGFASMKSWNSPITIESWTMLILRKQEVGKNERMDVELLFPFSIRTDTPCVIIPVCRLMNHQLAIMLYLNKSISCPPDITQ
jgi:hypothetical protein